MWWVGLFLAGCNTVEVAPVAEVDGEPLRLFDGIEWPDTEAPQCRVDTQPQFTDTDNTSCGVILGPTLAPGPDLGDVWVSPGFGLRRLSGALPGGTSALTAPSGSRIVADGTDVIRVHDDGAEDVLLTGPWTVQSLVPLEDGGLVVLWSTDQIAVYGPW
jgi:hypothetical protein